MEYSRKIDELGRIVIPNEVRKALSISVADEMKITISESKDTIHIAKKTTSPCRFCDEKEGVSIYKLVPVCKDCRAKILR